jgi:hypothetical protein
MDAPTPLQQSTNANTARVALQLTGQVGRFVWGTTGSYSRLTTNSSGAIGLDDSGNLVFDRTDSTLNTEGLQFSGQSALLPALRHTTQPAAPRPPRKAVRPQTCRTCTFQQHFSHFPCNAQEADWLQNFTVDPLSTASHKPRPHPTDSAAMLQAVPHDFCM